MRILSLALLLFAVVWPSSAQSHAAVPRLALLVEGPAAAEAGDLLTVELAKRSDVQLVERAQIDKVLREQALSAANQSYVQLGEILGADGLLLLDSREQANQPSALPRALPRGSSGRSPLRLQVRLIAVKPGVLLEEEAFSLGAELTQWAPQFAKRLAPLLPKLTVLAKEAVPISVVNLRSTLQSAETRDLEAQLTALVIEQLSRQPQLFVLERRHMQLLSAEKQFKGLDDTAFWNGSYLLDGTLDRAGYTKDQLTLNVRLLPPKGGAPLQFEISSSRTNVLEVASRLTDKLLQTLKLSQSAAPWNAPDEAQQFFEEAQWALKWRLWRQAQAASEAAHALGKQDLACALVRLRAYLAEIPMTFAPGQQRFNVLTGERPNYTHLDDPPDPKDLERARHVLELYEQFSRTSPEGEPKVLTGGPTRRNSDWYQLGIDVLTSASQVLQHFYFAAPSAPGLAAPLAELRALTRSVAARIAQAPSVQDSYFVGQRLATHDELAYTIDESNLFRCEVQYGCFWQERPEDALSLYRHLLSSPAFCYLHSEFWTRAPARPRLVAWTAADRQRLPELWGNFLQELSHSTNILWQMEASALAKADAKNEAAARAAEAQWWQLVRSHRDELVANNVELFYLGWRFATTPETEAMDQEYWRKTIPARRTQAAFEKQKQYLATFTPYDFGTFVQVFSERNYSKAQAAELLPLIVAYKSNLLAQASAQNRFKARGDANWIGVSLEKGVTDILHPPPSPAPAPSRPVQPKPALAAAAPAPSPGASTNAPEPVANVVTVSRFLPLPLAALKGKDISGITITAHHWCEHKLVLDLRYTAPAFSFDAQGRWQSTRYPTRFAIALLDPATEHWQVVDFAETDLFSANPLYHRTVLWRSRLFTSEGGAIWQYDPPTHQWNKLAIAEVGNCELFVVNEHLYAATPNLICEILPDNAGTRILASNRRQPPVSRLDAQELGLPLLFGGPGKSLRVLAANKLFSWRGNDWQEEASVPGTTRPPEVFAEGLLFLNLGAGLSPFSSLCWLGLETNGVEQCLAQTRPVPAPLGAPRVRPTSPSVPQLHPTWTLPAGVWLGNSPLAMARSNLYLLSDHSEAQDIVDPRQHLIVGKKLLAKEGYHAGLLCFSRQRPVPQKIALRFDAGDAPPPLLGENRRQLSMMPGAAATWMFPAGEQLVFGLETPGLPVGSAAPSGARARTGVWLLPVAEVDSARGELKTIPTNRP